MVLAQQRRGLGRNHELDHGARSLGFLGHLQQRNARRAGIVEVAGQRPDILGPRGANHDVGLLDADIEIGLTADSGQIDT